MLVGQIDQTCPRARAEETRSIIGDAVTHFQVIDNVGHGWFASANSDWFMDVVKGQL